jgi:hypothetical protein
MSAFGVIVQRYRAAMATTARGHIEKLPSGSFRVHVYTSRVGFGTKKPTPAERA